MVGLVIKETQHRGLGVFATKFFESGDLIECCRCLIVPRSEINISYTASIMRHYVVDWGPTKYALPTGFGMWYNHSYNPNAIIAKHLDLNEIHFLALRDILPDDEITFNYGGSPDYREPLWFEVKDS